MNLEISQVVWRCSQSASPQERMSSSSSSSSWCLRWRCSFAAVQLRSHARVISSGSSSSPLRLPSKNQNQDQHQHQQRRGIRTRTRTSRSRSMSMSMNMEQDKQAMETETEMVELNSAADFEGIASSDGHVSICGFGSLLSEGSARSTFPHLKNFRLAQLRGFRRVFAHVAPIFFDRGIANPQTGEISSLSAEPCQAQFLIVTVFDINTQELPAFLQREQEFRFLAVFPEGLDGLPFPNRAVLCARYSDEEYFQIRCQGSKEIYHERYGRYNIHKIWRDDILPCRIYLRHCVLAAKNLGEEAYNNFLDHTYISDRKTTIRQYLATSGAGIMEEEPPESLKTRYGG